MASSIFDTLTGVSMDSHAGLTVQSLLDQATSEIGLSEDSPIVTASQTPITLDEEDVFQCGKCKKQFISLHMFLCHKKEGPCDVQSLLYQSGMNVMDGAAIPAANQNENTQATAEAFDVTQLGVGHPIILSEADLLSFSIDQSSLQLSSTPQILPSFSVGMQGSFLGNTNNGNNFPSAKPSNPNEGGNVNNELNLGCQPIFLATQLQEEIPSPVGGFVVSTPNESIYANDQGQPPAESIENALPDIETIPTDNTISIPEGDSTISIPEGQNTISIPEDGSTISIPEGGNIISIPEGGNIISIPEEGNIISIPQCKNIIPLSEGENIIPLSEGDNIIPMSEDESIIPISEGESSISMEEEGNTISIPEGSVKGNDLLSRTIQALTDEGGGPECEGVNELVHESRTEVVSLGFLTMTGTNHEPHISLSHPMKKKHKCSYCGKTFAKNFDFQQHMRSHTGERPFQCVVCGRAFSQKSNVKKHMLTHRVWPSGLTNTLPSEPIQVISLENGLESGRQMNSERRVKDNNVQVVIDSSYVCQYCGRAFRSYLELKSHMKDHSNQKMFKCIQRKCGKTFPDLDSFIIHTKSHSSEEVRYRCHVCCEIFKSLAELGDHQYTHLQPGNSMNSSSSEKESDINSEAGKPATSTPKSSSRQYRCGKCRSYFATPEALEHHNETATHYHPCPHCKRIFHCERYLRRHLPTHGTARIIAPSADDPITAAPYLYVGTYECDICNKKFRTERYMTNHRLIHFENRPHACSQCPASFNRRDKLVRHQLIHEPVKRYKCPFRHTLDCKKEFNRQDKLKMHLLTHNSSKRFNCPRCTLAFHKQSIVNEHMKKCVGKEPLQKPDIPLQESLANGSVALVNSEGKVIEEVKEKRKYKKSPPSQPKVKRKRVSVTTTPNSKRKRNDQDISPIQEKVIEEAEAELSDDASSKNHTTTVVSTVVGEDGVPTIEIIVVPVDPATAPYGRSIGPYKLLSSRAERAMKKNQGAASPD